MRKLHVDHITTDKLYVEFGLSASRGRFVNELTAPQESVLDKINEWLGESAIAINSPDDRGCDTSEGLLMAAWEAAQQGVDHLTIVNVFYGNYVFAGSSEKLIRDLTLYMKGDPNG